MYIYVYICYIYIYTYINIYMYIYIYRYGFHLGHAVVEVVLGGSQCLGVLLLLPNPKAVSSHGTRKRSSHTEPESGQLTRKPESGQLTRIELRNSKKTKAVSSHELNCGNRRDKSGQLTRHELRNSKTQEQPAHTKERNQQCAKWELKR